MCILFGDTNFYERFNGGRLEFDRDQELPDRPRPGRCRQPRARRIHTRKFRGRAADIHLWPACWNRRSSSILAEIKDEFEHLQPLYEEAEKSAAPMVPALERIQARCARHPIDEHTFQARLA
jgi:hypothetical protein